jgi:hypothetical protein
MNKLDLAKKVAIHAGMNASRPVTTVNVSGEEAKIVDWVNMAYRDILTMHEDWRFLYDDFSFQTTIGKTQYTPTEAGIADLKNWITDDVRYYRELPNENDLFHCGWEEFKRVYLFGSARTQEGEPAQFSIMPNRTFVIWPIPTEVFTINGWCFKKGLDMVLDTDEPIFSEEYHWLIVWRAITYYGADYVEADRYSHGEREYRRIKGNMEYNELPAFQRGAPLC